MTPQFGSTASDYSRFRRPFPREIWRRLHRLGVTLADQTVLDVGCGTGLLATAMAGVAPRVVAVDLSLELLRHIAMEPRVLRICARVEGLPFDEECFDIVTAGQCWHWFDRRTAPGEVFRVLRPGGVLAVVYQMHIPMPGSVVAATEQLILQHHPRWRHANSAGINGQVLRDMQASGFVGIESFSFDTVEEFTPEQWRGLIRTTSAVAEMMSVEQISAFDRDHQAMLNDWVPPVTIGSTPESAETAQGEPVFQIPHRIFCAVAHRPLAEL